MLWKHYKHGYKMGNVRKLQDGAIRCNEISKRTNNSSVLLVLSKGMHEDCNNIEYSVIKY